jgi:Cdc6-like AAA superfamily ATPase
MIWKRRGKSPEADAAVAAATPDDQSTTPTPVSTEATMITDTPLPQAMPFGGVSLSGEQRPSFLDRLWASSNDPMRAETLPRFIATASDEVENQNEAALVRRRIALRDAIGASQPVTDREHFAGRHDALRQLIDAVEQQRLHVVIYGERGIGKTSLLHVFADTAREARYLVLYGSCGTETHFANMFRAFAARIPRIYHRAVVPNTPEAEAGDNFDMMLPAVFGPRELAELFSDVTGTRVILILDEYDRVTDAGFRRDVAELVKNLSDRAARVQLVLAGVAQNLDEILGYAPSVRRNIVGLPMRPMTPEEVNDMVGIAETAADLEYADAATRLITVMAGGSPYLVRLLAHHAGLAAIDSRSAIVTEAHATTAVERVLTEWNASLPRRVQQSLSREEARTKWPMLIAAARAGSAGDGMFTADEVVTELDDGRAAVAIERELRSFVGPNDLLEAEPREGETRFRFRYPGVSSLLLMSSAMARLSA